MELHFSCNDAFKAELRTPMQWENENTGQVTKARLLLPGSKSGLCTSGVCVCVVLAECLRCVCIDQGCAYVVFALCLCWSRSCLHHACVVLALIEVVQSSDRWCNASGCCIVMWEKKWIWQKRWTNPLCWRLAICQQWWWFHYKGAVVAEKIMNRSSSSDVTQLWFCCFQYLSNLLMMVMLLDKTTGQRLNE